MLLTLRKSRRTPLSNLFSQSSPLTLIIILTLMLIPRVVTSPEILRDSRYVETDVDQQITKPLLDVDLNFTISEEYIQFYSGAIARIGYTDMLIGTIKVDDNKVCEEFIDFFIGVGCQSDFVAVGIYHNTSGCYVYTDGFIGGQYYYLWVMFECLLGEAYTFALERLNDCIYYIQINGKREGVWRTGNPIPHGYEGIGESVSYNNTLNGEFQNMQFQLNGVTYNWDSITPVSVMKYQVRIFASYWYECYINNGHAGTWALTERLY